ncbi:MAG: helix-turn-helix domain-containing protein [candidate division Zixibacteria bacterium]|nr:helix-turn-helix domain-containing protein [candidate division Zixibacteria bacterium]
MVRLPKLKFAIWAQGTNQRAVAKLARIPESHLSMAINGRLNLGPDEKARIAAVLGRPERDLFATE